MKNYSFCQLFDNYQQFLVQNNTVVGVSISDLDPDSDTANLLGSTYEFGSATRLLIQLKKSQLGTVFIFVT